MEKIWYDAMAGVAKISPNCPDIHFSFAGEFEDAQSKLDAWNRDATMYAVFWNIRTADGFISEERDLIGPADNWNISEGQYCLVKYFIDVDKAYRFLEAMKMG